MCVALRHDRKEEGKDVCFLYAAGGLMRVALRPDRKEKGKDVTGVCLYSSE